MAALDAENGWACSGASRRLFYLNRPFPDRKMHQESAEPSDKIDRPHDIIITKRPKSAAKPGTPNEPT